MTTFNLEEINLMCIYDTGSRNGLLTELEKVLPLLAEDDVELIQLVQTVLAKVQQMSDLEYGQLILIPDFKTEDWD
ncbi:MAG: transposon-transfer assisting family protein [Eubacteriales bacterium]|nr:transposon-transfer assisting family protein [Eubacteriales bacterium]